MDTQQAIDALTDHMAVYHRSAERLNPRSPLDSDTKTKSKSVIKGGNIARQRVIEWFSGLSVLQRQATLTVCDKSWVLLLLQMQQKLDENGPGSFIILPDVPASNTSVELKADSVASHSSKQKAKEKKGRTSSGARRPRTSKVSKSNNNEVLGGCKKENGESKLPGALRPSNGKYFCSDSVSLPGLCYRKANGLLARLSSQQEAGEALIKGVHIFSSQDGEKGPVSQRPDPGYDSLTITKDFAKNLNLFLEVMDELSYGAFLEHPLGLVVSPWEETPWLQIQGYYSIAAFIANRLEISIWSSYSYSVGCKRPSKNLWLSKTNDSSKQGRTPAKVSDALETAAVAQSVHGRKQGCVDWWEGMNGELKSKLVQSSLAAATKSEAIKAVMSARGAAQSSKQTKRLQESSRLRKSKGKTLKWMSLSDTEADHYTMGLQGSSISSAVSPLLAGLAALKEVAELGILARDPSSSVTSSSTLFYTSLDSLHTLSDRVVRKSRNVLARVMIEAVEVELLQGEVGTKPLTNGTGKLGESKGSKEKKKRRKRSSAPKISQEDEELADVDLQPAKECEPAVREDFTNSVHLEAQRTGLPIEIHVSPDSSEDKFQTMKSQTHKSKTSRNGKNILAGGGLKRPPVHDNTNAKLEKFVRNDMHVNNTMSSPSSEIIGSHSPENVNPDTSFNELSKSSATQDECEEQVRIGEVNSGGNCTGGLSDILEPNKVVAATDSKATDSIDSLDKIKVFDRIGPLRQCETLKSRVLSPVGEEPTTCQAEPEVREVVDLGQDCRKSEENLTSSSNKSSPVIQSQDINSLQLRFGTLDLVTPTISVPPCSSSSTMTTSSLPPTPSATQRHISLQKKTAEKSEEGSDGASDTMIKEEKDSGIVKHRKESTSEPVFDSTVRRTGFRSQSLPSGILGTGKLFTTRPTPPFFPDDPLRVRNMKGGPPRNQRNTPAFAMFYSHEWPGYQQVRVSGSTVRPTATDRLHLDVIHDWPKGMDPSSVSLSNTAPIPGNLEWPPSFVQNGYSLTPVVGYSDLNEHKVVTLPPFSSSPYSSRTPPNGHAIVGEEVEIGEDRLYDTDLEVFEPYAAGDFEDFDGYVVSEEEGERQLEDLKHVKADDYNQFFGNGVMYWNSADYAGMGYSRPGSMSSDDSSWARREADLGVVLDDIVGIHPLPPSSYRGKGTSSSNKPSSTSPSQAPASLPLAFEQLGNSQVSQRVCMTRSAGSEFVNYASKSDDSQAPGKKTVGTTIGVVDGIMSDGFMPRLRPIVVVRDPGLSRSMVTNETVRLRAARSPHIVSRGGTHDFLGQGRRRRPSPPVIRHAPPPPPPSPVAGPKRRKGWMSARSGSSSPRHWGLTSWWNKEEVDGLEAHAISRDSVVGNGRRGPPIRPLSGAVVRGEHLVAIPPLALDQEHMADEALVMQSSVLYNKNPTLHLVITLFHTALQKEIEVFCMQVAAEKRLRKPFINTAVKKVAHTLQVLWPRSRTKMFGSNATGLALPTSDVDLVVSLPPVRKAREPIKQAGILEGRIDGVKETCLLHAARYLEDQEWVKSLQVIEHTVVPIIRLKAHILPHQCELGDISLSVKETSPMGTSSELADGSPTSQGSGDSFVKEGPWGSEADRQTVRLDISFEAPSNTGLRTSELVRELMGQFTPLTPLALVLKQFLADRSLDHAYKGGLSSYCQVLLITRFLQHQQYLGRPSSSQNLGSLLMDFLHFFGCVFDPRSMCVRIRGGGKYVSRDRGLSIDPLYIEDPIDYVNNVGSTCFRIQQIVKMHTLFWRKNCLKPPLLMATKEETASTFYKRLYLVLLATDVLDNPCSLNLLEHLWQKNPEVVISMDNMHALIQPVHSMPWKYVGILLVIVRHVMSSCCCRECHDGYPASCSRTFWVPRLPASQNDAFMILHEAGVYCKQQDIFPAFISSCILTRKHVSTLPLHFTSSL